MSRIVLTDPHGCLKTLKALVAKLPPGIPLTFAGDLIDRASDSRGVVDFVMNGGHDCIVGNHEVMMLDELSFGSDGKSYKTKSYVDGIWLKNGGDRCLDSYEVDGKMDIQTLKEHYDWIKSLPYYLEYPELKDSNGQHLLVTHSTAAHVWNKGTPKDSPEFKDYVTWERLYLPKKIDGIFNVYGHTPQVDKALVRDYFACIDTGACYKRVHYGRLTALQFPEMTTYVQENIE